MEKRKKLISIEIENRLDGSIIISGEYASIKDALEKNRSADLSSANLSFSDLRSANLRFANLRFSDLRFSDLRSANMSSADLRSANMSSADLRSANMSSVDMRSANLSSADLRSANLSFSDLRFSDLRFSDLRSANMSSANMSFSDLSSAKADEPVYMVDLYLLKMQPATTKLRAWKYLRDGKSPYQNYEYEVGKTYRFKDIYCDERNLCGPGGNVATLMWCLKDSTDADEFIEVEFLARDVVMPLFSDGKWRVKRFKVLKKVNRKKAIKILNDALARKPR